MKPSTIITTAVVVIAAVVLFVLFNQNNRKPTTSTQQTGTTQTTTTQKPATTPSTEPSKAPPPVVTTQPVLNSAQAIDKTRSDFNGDWLTGKRTESIAEMEIRYGPWMEYQAIIWSSPPGESNEYLALYPALGLNCGMAYRYNSPKPFYDAGLNAYLENVFRSPFFYLKDHLKRPEAEYPSWKEMRDAYYNDRGNKSLLERKPSLNDPNMWKLQEGVLTKETVGPFANLERKPVAINLRDEPSVTTSANPTDFDFSPVALDAFREWLKKKYGTLDALNKEWETSFTDWPSVEPMTTDEIRAREYDRIDREGKMNLAPWADHREFMDFTFAQITEKFVKFVQGIIPGSYVGLEGLQMPNAWGGYDYWKLIRAMNWAEPYDIRCSREITRSFNPHIPVVATGFETSREKLATKLWYLALMGDRGIIIWPFDDKMNDRVIDRSKTPFEISPVGEEVGAAMRDIRSGASDLVATTEQQFSPVAIYYSQASIRADWMFESRVDGKTWLRRHSSDESRINQLASARESLGKLIEDIGYQYNYVSYEQVANGELQKTGYKLLIAPRLHALSKQESDQIRKFVESGGTVLTDIYAGIMDENCRSEDTGLRLLLGIGALPQLLWVDKSADINVQLGLTGSVNLNTFKDPFSDYKENAAGKGKTINVGADIFYAYEKARRGPDGIVIRDYLKSVIAGAGIADPGISVVDETGTRPVAVETHFYRGLNMDIVGLGRNPLFRISEELKDLADKSGTNGPVSATVKLPYESFVYDAGRNGFLGKTSTVKTEIRPQHPAVLVLLSYEVSGIKADITAIDYGVHVSGQIETKGDFSNWAIHALTVFVEQDGKELPIKTLFTEKGSFNAEIPFPLGIKGGDVKIIVRDAASMKQASATINATVKGVQF